MDRSNEASACPDVVQLERLARGEAAEQVAELHVRQCGRCRAAVREIQENNEFLTDATQVLRSGECARWGEMTTADSIPAYRIIAEIHRGGQGVVYKAYHEPTRRFVAIKLLLQGAFATSRQRHRFEREIEIAAGLRHPGIVPVYDTEALPGGRVGFVMQFVDGVPLDQWATSTDGATAIAKGSEVTRRLQVLLKVCDAIRYAHEHGIIHRDLKPGNILVDNRDEPHVLDFGLAKAVEGVLDDRERQATLTQAGEMVGTFAYAAPEQLKGDPHLIDIRTDVYSLGVIAYELLTGQLPYSVGGSMSDVIRAITQTEPRSPSALCAGIDDELDTIILKALAKEPPRRYPSAGALLDDLTRYQRGEAIDAKRDSTWYMLKKTARRHRAVLSVAAGVVLLLLAIAITMTFQARHLAVERDRTAEALAESNLQRAFALSETNNAAAAEQLLWNAAVRPPSASGAPAPRNWPGPNEIYWALVELYQRHPCIATFRPTPSKWINLSLSPSAPIVASGGLNGEICIWELDPPHPLQTLAGHTGQVRSVQFSADGSALVSVGEDGTIRHWDVASGNQQRVTTPSTQQLNSMNVTPDGTRLVCGSVDGVVHVIDCLSGDSLVEWETGHSKSMQTVLDPSGAYVATFDPAGRIVQIWSTATGQHIAAYDPSEVDLRTAGETVSAAFVPGTSQLAIGYTHGLVRFWDWRAGKVCRTITGLGERGLALSPIGSMIAGGNGLDRTVRISSLAQPQQTTVLSGHAGSAPSRILFAPRLEFLLSAHLDGVVKQWELQPNRWREALSGHDDTIFCIRLSPDQATLVSGSQDHSIILWDYTTRQPRQILRGHAAGVTELAFSPDGSLLASGGHKEEPVILIWDVTTGQLLHRLVGHTDRVTSLCFSPDGRVLVSGSGIFDGTVRLWDVASGEEIKRHTLAGPDLRCFVDVSSQGESLAWSESEGVVVLADLNLQHVRRLSGHTNVIRRLVFSPNGTLLASASDDTTVRVWDVATGECRHVLQGHGSKIFGLAFSKDGTLIASADDASAMCLWHVATGRRLLKVSEPGGSIFSVLFADHDQSLLCAGSDREIAIRDLTYYDRHIAGNTDWQMSLPQSDGFDQRQATSLQQWATQILATPSGNVGP